MSETTPSSSEADLALPPGRTPAETEVTLAQVMEPHDSNLLGTVHGGNVLKLVDSIAGVVAARHSEGPVVTASVDEMVFENPVRVGDVLHLEAKLNWTGTSSMEVGVRASADRWDALVPRVRVATAYFVMVAVGGDGKPRRVLPVVPETALDHRRFAEAEIRRRHRLERRAEILATRDSHH